MSQANIHDYPGRSIVGYTPYRSHNDTRLLTNQHRDIRLIVYNTIVRISRALSSHLNVTWYVFRKIQCAADSCWYVHSHASTFRILFLLCLQLFVTFDCFPVKRQLVKTIAICHFSPYDNTRAVTSLIMNIHCKPASEVAPKASI